MSAIGTKRTYRVALHMSAFEGKADMRITTQGTLIASHDDRDGVSDGECFQDQVRWLDGDYLRGCAANGNSLRLFLLVMLSHALPIHLNFSVAPNIFQIFA